MENGLVKGMAVAVPRGYGNKMGYAICNAMNPQQSDVMPSNSQRYPRIFFSMPASETGMLRTFMQERSRVVKFLTPWFNSRPCGSISHWNALRSCVLGALQVAASGQNWGQEMLLRMQRLNMRQMPQPQHFDLPQQSWNQMFLGLHMLLFLSVLVLVLVAVTACSEGSYITVFWFSRCATADANPDYPNGSGEGANCLDKDPRCWRFHSSPSSLHHIPFSLVVEDLLTDNECGGFRCCLCQTPPRKPCLAFHSTMVYSITSRSYCS